jgi:hypothetical protein
MKAILEFNLPDDDYQLRWAQQGEAVHVVLMEHLEWLRGIVKYGSSDEPRMTEDAAQAVREALCSKIAEQVPGFWE